MKRIAVGVVAVALLLAGSGSDDPAPVAIPDGSILHGLGELVASGTPNASVTVTDWKAGIVADGVTYSAANVRVCVGDLPPEREPTVSWEPWSFIDPEAARYSDNFAYGAGLPEPQYPTSAPVQAGDCVSGWIAMKVPSERAVTEVRYSNFTDQREPYAIRFAVSQ